ncbi:MAG: DUF4179 domain-containing protein [Anaerolineales bacterium]|nr:DUF4179 domain-containing protein [Anaerolineales bacterium]
MKKHQVGDVLTEIVERDVPGSVDLWPGIRARLQPTRRRSYRGTGLRLRWPAGRLGWAFAALAAFLLLSGMVYAVGPAVSRVFRMVPSWQYVEEQGLVQDVHLSQTINGVTVTLEKVYADANQILIGYGISGLPDGVIQAEVTLTDEKGTAFRELAGAGVTGTSDLLDVSLPAGEGRYVVAFDGSGVEGAPPELELHLAMHLVRPIFVTPDATPVTVDGQEVESPVAVEALTPLTVGERTTMGPFVFDFRAPFLPARVSEVQQTAHAAGIAIRLQRVVVTPSETRITLCFQPPAVDDWDWTVTGALRTGLTRNYHLGAEVRDRFEQADGQLCYVYGLLAPIEDRRGEWTLRVTELLGFEMKAPYRESRLAGPWVFRFQAP